MAVAKTARVTNTLMVGHETVLVDLTAAEPLGFIGGQYLIVDSRIVLPNGKSVKRAYSLISSDAEQGRFQIAVKRIPDGLGSAFVHRLEPGTDISFSGPWGKFIAQDGAVGKTLILATDTGITAALGLMRATRFDQVLAGTTLIWLRNSSAYFLPDEFVREHVPPGCGEVRFDTISAVGRPERVAEARVVLRQALAFRGVARVFLAGDGIVNDALFDDVVNAGLPMSRERMESFFNMPKKSA
jgi:ferredoxin-NADP reductase